MPSAINSSSKFQIRPLPKALTKDSLLGAEILFDPETPDKIIKTSSFSTEDVQLLQQALWEHSVLVFRNQQGLDPNELPKLAAIWDEQMKSTHSGGAKAMKNEKNILSKNRAERIPRAEQVTVIGEGEFDGYEGMGECRLRHVDHTEFHHDVLSDEEIASGQTRFYRWHIDAPLYEFFPGKATLLHAIVIPDTPAQKVKFENGSQLDLAAGATAFISGARAFQLLTPEEQEFALNTIVHYAPRAYEWIGNCKATSDGLSIVSSGKEKSLDELTPFDPEKVQSLPMVWRSPSRPNKPHLQILGCCVYQLETTNPSTGEKTIISDLKKVRETCYGLQKKAMHPEYIYAHDWQVGDLVVFHNRGVWHSITGQLKGSRRLLWQCTMASEGPPEGM